MEKENTLRTNDVLPNSFDNEQETQEATSLSAVPYQLQTSDSSISNNLPSVSSTPVKSFPSPTYQLKENQEDSSELTEAPAAIQLQTSGDGAEGDGGSGNSGSSGTGSGDLPNDLQSGIESLSGISMNDVKVNYNSSKPAQLKAHAYAQGSNIEIGPGQEKHLPHEAWHVVQQKQGRVKPTTQLKGKVNVNDDVGLENEADVMGEKALQMKSKEDPGQQKSVIANSSSPVQLESYLERKKRERKEKRQQKRSSNIQGVAPTASDTNTRDSTVNSMSNAEMDTNVSSLEAGSSLIGTGAKATGEARSQLLTTKNSAGDSIALDGNREANIGGNTAAGAAGFFDMCLTIKAMKDNGAMNPKMIDQIFGLLQSGASVVNSVSSAANSVSAGSNTSTGSTAESVASFAGSAASGLGVLKNFVKLVTGVYKDFKAAMSDTGSSGAEKFEAVASSIQNALNTVSSSMAFAKSVMTILGPTQAVAKKELEKQIPGVGIAISGVNIAMEVYSIIKSESSRRAMRAEKKKLKEGDGSSSYGNRSGGYQAQIGKRTYLRDKFNKKDKTSQKKIKASIAKLDEDKVGLDAEIHDLTEQISNLDAPIHDKEQLIANLESELEKREQRYEGHKAKLKKQGKKVKRRRFSKRKAKIATAKQELRELRNQEREASQNKTAKENEKSNKIEQQGDLEHLAFLQSMQKLNKGRNLDSLFKIGTELVSIAGDIATLSVTGAVAGVPLKLVASGLTIAKAGGGALRQVGRNAAAKKYKKRKEANPTATEEELNQGKSRTEKIFNKDKSDKGIKLTKLKNAEYIMKQYAKLGGTATDEDKKRVEGYVKAAGAHPMAVYRAVNEAKEDNESTPPITLQQAKVKAFLSTIVDAM